MFYINFFAEILKLGFIDLKNNGSLIHKEASNYSYLFSFQRSWILLYAQVTHCRVELLRVPCLSTAQI